MVVRWWTVVVAAAGCDSYYGPCSGQNEPAEAFVDLSGGVPVFDWEYGTAYALSVSTIDEDGGYGRDLWHIQCGGDNLSDDGDLESNVCIHTPIAYGEPVDSEFFDTVNFTRPKDLVPGETYRMNVNTLIEDDGPPPPDEHPDFLDFLDWQNQRDSPHCGSAFTANVDFVAPDPVAD